MNKTAFITGASRGIGAAIAKQLAEDGYDLYLVCKSSIDKLQKLKEELEDKYSIMVQTFQGDISDYEFVKHCFQNLNNLDLLINNAGISYVGLLSDMSPDEWNKILGTNLSALFYTSKLAIPLMLKNQAGKIINISSVWGNVGASMEVAYSATKGGVNSFTKALAKELGPSNIQVNAIACGLIDTDMNKCFSKEEISQVIEEIPSDRIGTPEEVAQMVKQIVNAPTYLTGQIISLDGGWQ